MTTAFSGGNASTARTRCHKFHFQSRRCRDKLTCLLRLGPHTHRARISPTRSKMCGTEHMSCRGGTRAPPRMRALPQSPKGEEGDRLPARPWRSLFRHLLKGGGGGGLCRSLGRWVQGSNNGRCKETLIVARRMGWEASCLA